ncbi:hypothetical protein MKK88_01600 [Methylobacterium sp. E-005]|uniref:hypothetical protein n=1 Tax=Methylobacterium sp. E-005 TaxID=2836549 RepID=UPI001FBB555E|nr:hypothetical protein [Methylobacterium sp. E-005]MCJ2084692.1 hypothetical protein [Methylobacterium sp. E-005]
MNPRVFQHGSGEITRFSKDLDFGIANTEWWIFQEGMLLPPKSFIFPGAVQGANMFFLREVLAATGGVRHVGPLESNDLMTAHRASQAGYTGVMLRGPKVHHDHGRRTNTPEAERVKDIYAKIAGAYFAQLAVIGSREFLPSWQNQLPEPGRTADLRRWDFRSAHLQWKSRGCRRPAARNLKIRATHLDPAVVFRRHEGL